MTSNIDVPVKYRKHALYIASVSSILYLALLPIMLTLFLYSLMAFVNWHPLAGLIGALFLLLVPISMPVSVYIMWSKYLRGLYKKTLFFSILPILTLCVAILVVMLLETIFR